MARYIDIDLLKEMIEAKADTVINAKQQFHYIAGWLDHLPPADVVPKSEVENLQAEVKVLTENSITSKYPCCVSCSRGLILTKSLEEYDELLADIATEVAREIFEEIDELLVQNATMQIATSTLHCKLAELKKKYTENKGE